MREWPPGTVALQAWLEEREIDRRLSHRYVKAGWMEHLGHGAYVRAGDTVSWRGAVYALQKQGNVGVWPGGATALSLQGFGHHVGFGGELLSLWGEPGSQLPGWFRRHDWGQPVRFRRPRLFAKSVPDAAFHKRDHFVIEISSLERAAFEVVYEISDAASFGWAAELVQALVSLRPALMQQYLDACTSIKVKRILLFLASHYRLPWLERIDLGTIGLGRGKRQVVEGGLFDSRFQITVPREFARG